LGLAAGTSCSPSESANSTTTSIVEPSTSPGSDETSLTATERTAPCPTNELLNMPQPTPHTVTTIAPVEIEAITASPYPEGPIASVGRIDDQHSISDPEVFEAARAAVSLPLPAPGDQGCCQGGDIVTIDLSDGQRTSYGPCVLPNGIAEARDVLYTALND
jgi:hypothetical protein